MQPAYLRYSHDVESCCTFFDVDLLSLVSFDFRVPLDLLELLSLKLNNLLHNFGVEVIGELPLASGNKPIIIKYLYNTKHERKLIEPPTPDAKR